VRQGPEHKRRVVRAQSASDGSASEQGSTSLESASRSLPRRPIQLARISHRLTGEARDRRGVAWLRLLGTIGRRRFAAMDRQDCRSLRWAARTDWPLTHFVSVRGEICGLGRSSPRQALRIGDWLAERGRKHVRGGRSLQEGRHRVSRGSSIRRAYGSQEKLQVFADNCRVSAVFWSPRSFGFVRFGFNVRRYLVRPGMGGTRCRRTRSLLASASKVQSSGARGASINIRAQSASDGPSEPSNKAAIKNSESR